jgi:alkylation response protein AidB-like acyl-CoA dehydrogenase
VILDEQQTMIRDVARQFARQRLAPHAARRDRESHFPIEEMRELGRLVLREIQKRHLV